MEKLTGWENTDQEIIGVVPAGGEATRISPLPCSKEIFPIGFRVMEGGTGFRPKAVSHYLLESMRAAGIEKVYIILRMGKWDIPEYLGDGSELGLNLVYLILNLPYGAPYTIDQAFPHIKNELVALGYPDILFKPQDAYVRLIEKLRGSQADVVLGLFETSQPEKADMVALNADGDVQEIVIKKPGAGLRYAWVNAVWTPRFTHFMHGYLSKAVGRKQGEHPRAGAEWYVGDVIRAAIQEGFRVASVIFEGGTFLDIGTPENLVKAVKEYSHEL